MIRTALTLALFVASALPCWATEGLLDQLRGTDPVQADLVEATYTTPELQSAYFRGLGGLSPEAAKGVLRRLGSCSTDSMERLLKRSGYQHERSTSLAAVEVLPEILGAEAADPLFKLSKNRDFEIAEGAIIALGYLKSKKVWRPLLQELEWELDRERSGASGPRKSGALIKALARLFRDLQDPSQLRDLLRAIPQPGDFHREVGMALLSVLAESKSSAATPFLLAVLNDPASRHTSNSVLSLRWERETRAVLEEAFGPEGTLLALRPLPVEWKALAARGLGLAREARASQYLVKALRAREAELRLAALRAISPCLGKPRDEASFETALQAVVPLLTDASRPVRTYAWKWLKRETGTDLPQSYPAWRRWLLQRRPSDRKPQ